LIHKRIIRPVFTLSIIPIIKTKQVLCSNLHIATERLRASGPGDDPRERHVHLICQSRSAFAYYASAKRIILRAFLVSCLFRYSFLRKCASPQEQIRSVNPGFAGRAHFRRGVRCSAPHLEPTRTSRRSAGRHYLTCYFAFTIFCKCPSHEWQGHNKCIIE
jgi:hypothetical protein